MALELIKINEFPESVDTKDWFVVGDVNGVAYKLSKDNLEAELGINALMQFGGAIVPTSTPDPTGDFFWIATEEGTYTDFGGVVVPAASMAVISRIDGVFTSSITTIPQPENKIPEWEAGTYVQGDQRIHNGQIWSVNVPSTTEEPGAGTDWVAKTDKGAEVVDNLETEDPDKALSSNQGTVIRPRILPDGDEFESLDRPDLEAIYGPLIKVDSEGRLRENAYSKRIIADDIIDRPDVKYAITDRDGNTIYEQKAGIQADDVKKAYFLDEFDRPDKALIIVDKYNRIISEVPFQGKSTPAPPEPFIDQFYNPDPVDSFTMNSSLLVDYTELIGAWESLRSEANVNPNVDPYITRQNLGKTSTKNLDIWRYDFKPSNPTKKIILLAGTHGSEKVYIKLLLEFMTLLTKKWYVSPALNWIRNNVHIVAVPCMNPSAITGYTEGSQGGRRAHETDDIPVSWTKSGTTVTVTFDVNDFPDTDGRLDGATYFSNPNIANKLWISLFDSTGTGLPDNGYVISSVIDGQTVTVEVPETGGDLSGTASMYVGVDINRNFQADGSTVWDNYTPSTTSVTKYSNDRTSTANDNKGTKPFSLAESIILRDLLDSEYPYLFVLDNHSGAGKNYLHNNYLNPEGYSEMKNLIIDFQSRFMSYDFSRVIMDLPNVPYMNTYSMEKHDRQGFTIEWSQPGGSTPITSEDATDAFRWIITVVTVLTQKLKY